MKKTAIITGGSKGIGLGIAKYLAVAGYDITVMGTSKEEKVSANLDIIRNTGAYVLYVQGNLMEESDRQKLIDNTINRFGRIDVLVNNAGVAPRERNDILSTTEKSYDFVMDINLKGTFFLTQLVANKMINQLNNNIKGDFSIVNISSISSYTSSVNRGEYCISKAGVSMITNLFADRLSEYGINVYEVRPGIIATDMTSGVVDKYDKLIAEGLTPIKRWGTPNDIGKAVKSLVSGDFPFSTGICIDVDGGFHLRRL